MLSELSALVSTAAAIAAGLGLVFICKRYLNADVGSLLVAVLFAPAVLYLGLSGRLVEFKGLGFEAKFQQVAAQPVTPTNIRPVSVSASAIQEQSERVEGSSLLLAHAISR